MRYRYEAIGRITPDKLIYTAFKKAEITLFIASIDNTLNTAAIDDPEIVGDIFEVGKAFGIFPAHLAKISNGENTKTETEPALVANVVSVGAAGNEIVHGVEKTRKGSTIGAVHQMLSNLQHGRPVALEYRREMLIRLRDIASKKLGQMKP